MPQTEPANPASKGAADRLRFARALRGLTGARQAKCRVTRVSDSVQLVETQDRATGAKRIVARGVSTCGSGHSCPSCAGRIAAVRGEELTAALNAHGRERTLLATLTMRHRAGMSLRALQRLLSQANSELWAGRAGRNLRDDIGLIGSVRGSEQTHGGNGWHPHQHQAWFLQEPLAKEKVAEWQFALTDRWSHCLGVAFRRLAGSIGKALESEDNKSTRERFAKLWGARYLKEGSLADCAKRFAADWKTLGTLARILPDAEHGVRLDWMLKNATYLTKLGLEIAGIAGKASKSGHETHWQVYKRAASGDRRARRLVREHYVAMKGKALLVWSRGLRDLLGLAPEREDADVASESIEPTEDVRLLREISGTEWDAGTADGQGQLYLAGLLERHAADQLEQDAPGHEVTNLAFDSLRRDGPDVRGFWWENWGKPARCPVLTVTTTAVQVLDEFTRRDYLDELRAYLALDMCLR